MVLKNPRESEMEGSMYKNWAVTFYSEETKKVRVDVFTCVTEGEARRFFGECYRHETYKILNVVEIPK